jgi:DNA polymerase III epsilon subunit-like protein
VNIAIVDTETTGVPSAEWARVVEIGAVALDASLQEIGSFASLCMPDVFDHRADRALAYNNIAFEDVVQAPSIAGVRHDLYAWMSTHDVTEVWAYNRVFDEGMLQRSHVHLPWAGCVMRLARLHMPKREKDPPLSEAAIYFLGRQAVTTTHRALDDVRLAAGIYCATRVRV